MAARLVALLTIGGCGLSCGAVRRAPGRWIPSDPPRNLLAAWHLKYVEPETGPVTPQGPEVEPVGRHIQLLWTNHPHGLLDRLQIYFRPLAALGHYHDAVVHIKGGRNGVRDWLSQIHTVSFAKSWDRYFDMKANDGNPFHDIMNFKGCRTLRTSDVQRHGYENIFAGGYKCVNFVDQWDTQFYAHKIVRESNVQIQVSSLVKAAAQRVVREHNVSNPYGSVHIRRCDRLRSNEACTAPVEIHRQVEKHNSYPTWLVFAYAEAPYLEKLRTALKPLRRQFVFEDDVVFDDGFKDDNYFTFLVGRYLNAHADTIIETHLCSARSQPYVFTQSAGLEGLYLTRSEEREAGLAASADEAYLATEGRFEAVCGNPKKDRKPAAPSH